VAPAVSREGTLRGLGAARFAVGGCWLAALGAHQAAAGATLPKAGRLAATALALRDVAQGALLVVEPRQGSAQAGAVIDVLHLTSMLPVIALVPRYRVPAAVSATAAALWCAAAVWALGRKQGHDPARAVS
jgi:hypothetical protein